MIARTRLIFNNRSRTASMSARQRAGAWLDYLQDFCLLLRETRHRMHRMIESRVDVQLHSQPQKDRHVGGGEPGEEFGSQKADK